MYMSADASAEAFDEKFAPRGAVNVAYNIARGSYVGFQNQLNMVLRTNKLVEGIPVMVAQNPYGPPPTWILIQLTGDKTAEKITVALRNDNAYVAGFSNARGMWFSFPRYQRLIDGSTALTKREDYPSLIDGKDNLVTLNVNRDAALEALRFLSTYKPSDDGSTLGISLARVIVVVAEAARFKRIYNTVLQGFQQQPQSQALLALTDANSVVLWGDLSQAIIDFSSTGKWIQDKKQLEKFTAAGITGPQQAIDAVKLLVRPQGFKVDEE